MFDIEELENIDSNTVDLVLCRPDSPENEADWHENMGQVTQQVKRIIKDSGSAVFFLEPYKIAPMKLSKYAYDFVSKVSENWNLVDVLFWIRPPAYPVIARCIWFGSENCHINTLPFLSCECSEVELFGWWASKLCPADGKIVTLTKQAEG